MTDSNEQNAVKGQNDIPYPPRGLMILMLVGPGIVWVASYIGSGEVILTPRSGAILGTAILWVPILSIFLKFWIGIGGARYTVCTGEGQMDMFSRMPGPRNWAVWIAMVGQFICATVAISALASAAAAFHNALFGINTLLAGWLVTLFSVTVVWSGKFDPIKYILSIFILIMLIGVGYIAWLVFPDMGALLFGFFGFSVPSVPQWAIESGAATANPWSEIIPLFGWAAGGFGGHAFYTYWILESGYGMAAGRGFGKKADEKALKSINTDIAKRVKGWCNVVYVDGSVATFLGMIITAGFLIVGAGVLGAAKLAPSGGKIAYELSAIFSSIWGKTGAIAFLVAGAAALMATNIGQFAGWSRLMSDCLRIIFPKFFFRFPSGWVYKAFAG